MLTIQLSDNSPINLNVEDESEAERVWGITRKCLPAFEAQSAYPKITKGVKRDVAKVKVISTLLKYCSTGQKTMILD